MKSYQNLVLLQNLYRLKAIGFDYVEHFEINQPNLYTPKSNFQELLSSIDSCHLCDLSKSRKQSMVGYGNKNAKLMIIDFSVSDVQDQTNSYYVGNSGKSLQIMVEEVLGLSIEDTYLTHCIKCKPLTSNKPSHSEWNSCKNYLFAQIESIKPKIIVTLGENAYKYFTSDDGSFEQVRGHIIDLQKYKLIPIYHPSFVLRNPKLRKVTFSDLKTIKSCL